MSFPEPLIFIVKEKMIYHKLIVPENNSEEFSGSKAYLERFKEIINLPYTKTKLMSIIEEKNSNYVIINDNFKKMVLLVYRIIANVPVTCCGKTSLITKLNKILNSGVSTLFIINILDKRIKNYMIKWIRQIKKQKN